MVVDEGKERKDRREVNLRGFKRLKDEESTQIWDLSFDSSEDSEDNDDEEEQSRRGAFFLLEQAESGSFKTELDSVSESESEESFGWLDENDPNAYFMVVTTKP